MDLEKAQLLAAHLKALHPSRFAFTECEGRVYLARHAPLPLEPNSPVVKLVQSIYECYPEEARKIVRNRIFTNHSPTELCHGIVKVSAKRMSVIDRLPGAVPHAPLEPRFSWELVELDCPPPPSLSRPEIAPQGERLEAQEAIELATRLSGLTRRSEFLYLSDRPVGAVLLAEDGTLLDWAINTNFRNRTRHAELNLIQNWFKRTRQPLPARSRLYVTLKPCRMCAGAIWTSAEDVSSLKVFFIEDDPGPGAQQTVLDIGSERRRQASSNERELCSVIQEQLK